MKKIEPILFRIVFTLFIGVWGILFGLHSNFKLKGRHFYFYEVPQEIFVAHLIGISIAFIGFSIGAFFIAKKCKAQKPYNAVLGTLIVMTGALGIKWLIGF